VAGETYGLSAYLKKSKVVPVKGKKVKISLLEAVETNRVPRG
jgi:hypothetical protein